MQVARRVAAVVEAQRAEVGHGEDAKAATHDGFGVVERAIGKGDARLEIAL